MSPNVDSDQDHFEDLRREWYARCNEGDWERRFESLIEEWREVEWRSGGRTLLSALGLQFNEVKLCRGLAWLLDPEGGHGMGHHPLHAFLQDLEVDVPKDAPVTIFVEESNADTRADIVLRLGGATVVIEAKVFAGEQPQQADRLFRHWGAELEPTLVFLTRTGQLPYTATESDGRWVARTWRSVAGLLRTCADRANLDPSAGAREFIETIGAL